ncbi:similar to vacuolar protein sorting vps16 [Plenodomus lingam JN3]|uniref:Probable vacuolar protein sorting-associated protein 16 homolog n=1 Tax=Leptosphaeria maculans (strain JN3 / isolate v23.1.3 / race Av1-4-5-6-7-8) TaxID=985895 RepID=E4ZYI9_LEPMJ|nr:similar to vacuolar protein sorting vps16 [Plenodomus lingam JN3]CBX96515.1 similar to vacuolar protein sorting vps16 [Plenodomus lingam JN3]
MSKPTANWEKVGDKFYRKVQLYTAVFDSDLELENYNVVGAPYSGAVAVYRDEEKLHTYRGPGATKASIDLYSCAGKLIRSINWDKGTIKGLGWSEDEKLLVVSSDGTVRCYCDLQGDFVPFTLGHGADEYGVVSCRFYSTGFVALLGNNHLISITSYTEPRPKLLAIPPNEPVVSWSIIPPAYSLSRSIEVILAIGATLYVVDATEAEDRNFNAGPFRHIGISPRAEFLAFYTDDGKVWVVSGDWSEKLSEYDSGVKTVPKDMQWCGSNAVALAWEDEVHLIGPNSAATKFYYDTWVHLLPDVDGIRLFTNEVCEFIQKVPDEAVEVFRLGSDSPAANLLEASSLLDQKSPKADDLIQLIRPNLAEAVDTCIKAAAHEYNIHWQKALLKAASYGKSVLDLYSSDDFVDICDTLRVLNAVRFYEVGLPLSYDQYRRMTPEKLIERLTNRNEYLLALRIADHLHLPANQIHGHWAQQKVRVSQAPEEEICSLIVKKLCGKPGVSFEEIARAAYDEGRVRLATELLNYEPRAGKQVPLLLNMKEDTIALDKAIESGDTDLVYHVLLHLRKKLPLASFFRVINSRPMATALVESSAWDQDRELLKDLYYQDDRRLDGSNLLLLEALTQPDLRASLDKLKLASKYLQDSRDNAAVFQRQALDDASKLLKMQEAFEKDLGSRDPVPAGSTTPGQSFIGLSANQTIFHLIRQGHYKRAQRVQAEFKISDKTYAYVRLRALVAARHWVELEESAKQKKSPIGWEPFFNEILAAGNTRVASVFISKCTNLTVAERTNMWVKCGLLVKAGEEAFKAKDRPLLEEIRDKAGGSAAVEIERYLGMLGQGRR